MQNLDSGSRYWEELIPQDCSTKARHLKKRVLDFIARRLTLVFSPIMAVRFDMLDHVYEDMNYEIG